ncbi:MAG: biotin--[acetyl-CoA-carboxylase] ligase [Leptospirillia bacterium]
MNGISSGEGLPPPRLRRIHCDPPVFFARTLTSTNDALRDRILAEGAPPFTALLCGRQTRGRGRPGNAWTTLRGDLAMSVWIPEGAGSGTLPLSLYVTGACLEALDGISGGRVRWKYPNDLCLDPAQRPEGGKGPGKVGGILVEQLRKDGVLLGHIAGIGLNMASEAPRALPSADALPPAVLPPSPGLSPLSLSVRIALGLRRLLEEGEEILRERLDRHLLWKGRWVVYALSDVGTGPAMGRIAGLAGEGFLQIESPGGGIRLLPPHVRRLRLLEGGEGPIA